MEEFERAGIGCRVELLSRFIGKRKLTERNELQAVLRTNIHAAATQDALGSFGFIAFENRVDPALQAARGFAPGLLFREANLDFSDAGAALQGNYRHAEAGIFVVLRGHLVMVKERDLHELRLGLPFGPANKLVDFFRGFLPVSNGIDDQARTESDISGSEDSRGGGHERCGVNFQSSLPRGFDTIRWLEESRIRGLADGQ